MIPDWHTEHTVVALLPNTNSSSSQMHTQNTLLALTNLLYYTSSTQLNLFTITILSTGYGKIVNRSFHLKGPPIHLRDRVAIAEILNLEGVACQLPECGHVPSPFPQNTITVELGCKQLQVLDYNVQDFVLFACLQSH